MWSVDTNTDATDDDDDAAGDAVAGADDAVS